MILVTGKYPDIHPFAFKSQGPEGQEIPWSHLQILDRQLIAFDKDGDVIGTVDLALASQVKIVRQADIVSYKDDGASLTVFSKKAVELPASPLETIAYLKQLAGQPQQGSANQTGALQSGDDYDYDDDYDDDDYEY